MWGYGARHAALSTGTSDPLNASAVVIQAGEKKLAIVGLGSRTVACGKDDSKHPRADQGEGRHRLFLHRWFAHAPRPGVELTDEDGKGKGKFDAAIRYYKELEDGIVAAILEADAKLVPARLATGAVKLDGFNRNRHTKIEPKSADRDLTVMRLDDTNGKPVAVIVNFTAHPTMIPAEILKFSADYAAR
jgi:hypothetical protein